LVGLVRPSRYLSYSTLPALLRHLSTQVRLGMAPAAWLLFSRFYVWVGIVLYLPRYGGGVVVLHRCLVVGCWGMYCIALYIITRLGYVPYVYTCFLGV